MEVLKIENDEEKIFQSLLYSDRKLLVPKSLLRFNEKLRPKKGKHVYYELEIKRVIIVDKKEDDHIGK